MVRVGVFAGCLVALAVGACSLSAPTLAEYASVSSRAGAGSSATASAAGQGNDGAVAGGAGADGGASDGVGSAGDPGVGGDAGAASGLGTAGVGIGGAAGAGSAVGGDTGIAGEVGSAGNPGSSGALCSDHPLTPKWKWIASAATQFDSPPSVVLDGSSSRWSTGSAQNGGEWLQVDFGATVSLRRINLQQGPYTNDYPRNYAVYVSDSDHSPRGPVRASGVGTSGVTTTIVLPETVAGRYLLIRQTGNSLSWWSVEELEASCFDG